MLLVLLIFYFSCFLILFLNSMLIVLLLQLFFTLTLILIITNNNYLKNVGIAGKLVNIFTLLYIIIGYLKKEIFDYKFLSNLKNLFSLVSNERGLLEISSDSNGVNFDTFFIFSYADKIPINLVFEIKVDSLSLIMLFLTSLVFFVVLFTVFDSYAYDFRLKYIVAFVYFIDLLVNLAFVTTNLLTFYFFFESILVPMFLIIIVFGSRARKIKAAFLFFLYTIFFSFFIFYGIVFIWNWYGSLNYFQLYFDSSFFSLVQQNFLWFCFFIGLSVKVPMFPLHLWLPEAHVEAPAFGSIILAGVLLKLGGYGIIRFVLPLFIESSIYFRPLVIFFCLYGAVYGSILAITQSDIKKIVAYASVSHMNLAIVGVFSFSTTGLIGAFLLFVSHGVTSSALFFLIGSLYNRYHSRLIRYFLGLVVFLPFFCFYLLFFSFSNMGFPGTLNSVAELFIVLGILEKSSQLWVLIIVFIPFLLSVIYGVFVYNKISYGVGSENLINPVYDLNQIEFFILFILSFFTIFFGFFVYYMSSLLQTDFTEILLKLTYA